MTHPNRPDTGRNPQPQHHAQEHIAERQIDLDMVAEIVRRAGLDCRVDPHTSEVLLARRTASRPGPWTVTAGTFSSAATRSRAFVGPADSTRTRVLRTPDERHLAALVVLQALRDDPRELLTHDEAAACGLADDLNWA
jgi:hypothetical protein